MFVARRATFVLAEVGVTSRSATDIAKNVVGFLAPLCVRVKPLKPDVCVGFYFAVSFPRVGVESRAEAARIDRHPRSIDGANTAGGETRMCVCVCVCLFVCVCVSASAPPLPRNAGGCTAVPSTHHQQPSPGLCIQAEAPARVVGLRAVV